MNNNTPAPKPNIALYVAIAVVIALLVGIGMGMAVSSYQKSESLTKPQQAPMQSQVTPAKPSGRDPNVVYSIVKEPENTNPIKLTCDFNIKDYVENPYGHKLKSLSGAFTWINNFISGGLKKGAGAATAKNFEATHFSYRPDSVKKIYHSIGNKHTTNKKYYLVVFEPPTNYTFIETPEHIAKRLAISPETLIVRNDSCATN